jgi:shikimate dehydrogenase
VRALDALHFAAFADADLFINATSAGHAPAARGIPAWPAGATIIGTQALCYDLSYGTAADPFLAWARAAGARRVSDGLGMLIEQAAESFASWHGRHPHTAPVYFALRARAPVTGA